MFKKTLIFLFAAFLAVETALADSYLWQGNNRNSVNTVSAWFNETTGATATVQPSASDTVTMDFRNSSWERGSPYALQRITLLSADINWGDTVFKNVNANNSSTDLLDKFISQGTGRNIVMKSLSYENDVNPNYLWLGGGDSATPANITITNSVRMGSASDTSAMRGVLVFGGNSNVGAGSYGGAIGPCQKVSIGGDVVAYGNSTIGFNTSISGTSVAPSALIGGVIRMNALNEISPTLWLTNRTYSSGSGLNTYVKARGLDGSGIVKNNLSSGFSNFNTTLEIATNSASDNFTFDGQLNTGNNSANKLNLVKSGAGSQTLILRDSNNAPVSSTVEVNGGVLELYNPNAAFSSLALGGGKFGVASAEEGAAGTAKFGTGQFNGGKFAIDIFNETSCDVILFSNGLNIGVATTVEVGLSYYTGVEGTNTYSIIETSTISGIDPVNIDDYFTAVDSSGNAIESASFFYDGTNINLTINVPEPSTYAAIFGALALGFVAWRKRK